MCTTFHSLTHSIDGVLDLDLPINGEYISQILALDRNLRLGIRSKWLNAISLHVPSTQIAQLLPRIAMFDFVAKIEKVGRFARDPILPTFFEKNAEKRDYGLSLPQIKPLDIPKLHDQGLIGTGVTILVLDTGFNLDHECFATLNLKGTFNGIDGLYILFSSQTRSSIQVEQW